MPGLEQVVGTLQSFGAQRGREPWSIALGEALRGDGAGSVLFSDFYGKSLFYIKEELDDPYLKAYLNDPALSPGRHFGKINVLFEGGDVRLVEPDVFFDENAEFWGEADS